MKCFILAAFAVIFWANKASSDLIPVFSWGAHILPKPALNTLSSDDFKAVIEPITSDHMIVVFAEDQLSTTDLSSCKLDGDTCFKNVEQFKQKRYYSAVEDPIDSLRTFTNERDYVEVNEDGTLSQEIEYKAGKVIVVSFDSIKLTSENDFDKYVIHDKLIGNVFKDLLSKGPLLGIYTGKHERTSNRKVREAQESEDSAPQPQKESIPKQDEPVKPDITHVIHITDKDNKDAVLVAFTKILYYSESSEEPKVIEIKEGKLHNYTEKEYHVELLTDAAKDKINFALLEDGGYWSLQSMTFNAEAVNMSRPLRISTDVSYYCTSTKYHFGTTNKSLVWEGFQVQGRFKPLAEGEILKFRDAWHCIGFTSPPIWSGLFITFMLLFILSIGISWMMDINTMDRFDDPKGKTITINVTD